MQGAKVVASCSFLRVGFPFGGSAFWWGVLRVLRVHFAVCASVVLVAFRRARAKNKQARPTRSQKCAPAAFQSAPL
eukprot:10076258-Alexandrium_andersonii.AAC.1